MMENTNEEFPFWAFFMQDSPLFDKAFLKLERIGGPLSYLTSEYPKVLNEFKTKIISPRASMNFEHAKVLQLLFAFGVVSEVRNYMKYIERLLISIKGRSDLTNKGQ